MKKGILWIIVVIIVVVLIVVFSGKDKGADETGPIKIGLSMPLTGPIAGPGEWGVEGANLAKNDNTEFFIEDDMCGSTESSKTVNKLVNINNISSLFIFCGSALPGTTEFTKDKAVVISPSVKSVNQKNYFTTYSNLNEEMAVLSDYIINKKGIKRIAQFYQADATGEAIREAFVKEFTDMGGEVEIIQSVSNFELGDFRTSLLKIKNDEIPAVMVTNAPGNFVNAVKQINDLGLDVDIFSNALGVENPVIVPELGEMAEGIVYTSPYDPEDIQETDFYKNYLNENGKDPSVWTVFSYDSLNILEEISDKCGDDYGCKIDLLNNEEFDSLTGKVRFVDNMLSGRNIYLKEIKDGKFTLLK